MKKKKTHKNRGVITNFKPTILRALLYTKCILMPMCALLNCLQNACVKNEITDM